MVWNYCGHNIIHKVLIAPFINQAYLLIDIKFFLGKIDVGALGSTICICVYIGSGPIRGHEVVREGVNIIKGVHVSKWRG